METSYKNRFLRINTDVNHIDKLEYFIENICDDFRIYDAYYGNIISANTIIFDICCEISNKKTNYIDYVFKSDTEGIYFVIQFYDLFLDIVRHYEKIDNIPIDEPDSNSFVIKMKMVKLLTDKMKINAEEDSIMLVYYITGVNELLTNQRIEMLEKYYSSLTEKIKH